MIGLAAVIAAFALVDLGLKLADPTMRQYWSTARRDGEYLAEVLRFEKRGGRVQDLGRVMSVLSKTFRQMWVGRAISYAIVVAVCIWLRDQPLMAAGVVGVLMLLSSAANATLVWMYGLQGGGERQAGERGIVALQLLSRATLGAVGVWLLLLGAIEVQRLALATGLLLIAMGVAVVHLAHWPARQLEVRLWRRRAPVFSETTPSDSVLYLRSFTSDAARLYSGHRAGGIAAPWVETYTYLEELLGDTALSSKGHLVAIGRPGSADKRLGAAKSYWDDEDWQQAVIKTVARVETVIVTAGLTGGLGWEIGMLRELNQVTKLLVVFPPGGVNETRAAYERLMADAGNPGNQLPLALTPALVGVAFDETQQPIHYTAPGRNWRTLMSATTHFLSSQQQLTAYDQQGLITQVVDKLEHPDAEPQPAAPASDPPQQRDRPTTRQRLFYQTSYFRIDDEADPEAVARQYSVLGERARGDGLHGLALLFDSHALAMLRKAGRTIEAHDLSRRIIGLSHTVGPFRPPWTKDWYSGADLALESLNDLIRNQPAKDYPGIRNLLQEQQEYCRQAKRPAELAESLYQQGRLEMVAKRTDDAAALFRESASRFAALGDIGSESAARRRLSQCTAGPEAAREGARAVELARLYGDQSLLDEALASLRDADLSGRDRHSEPTPSP